MQASESAPEASQPKKGHPPGLYVLFFAEMWERMSYYGMRSLLVLYMTQHLFLKPEVAQEVIGFGALRRALEAVFGPLAIQPLSSQVYGLYTGLVFFTPLLGGLLADRVLGQRKSVVVGGVIMAIGHFLMSIESLFFPALLFIIIGNGAFKPNVSTQVGLLYEKDDPRRDRAFTIFYVGINTGSLLAPYVCGTLGQKVGWHWGFGAAGVGMLLGLGVYLWGQRYLPASTLATGAQGQKSDAPAEAAPLTREERGRVLALVVLAMVNIIFWAVYEQQGNTMQLWADKNTYWPTVFGWQIPSTWFQSFNPALIIAFTPLVNLFWARQAKKGTEPSTVLKLAIGCTALGLCFLVMIAATRAVGEGAQGSILWLFACNTVLTVGEIYFSPIGLSLVTKVAPARMVSLLMGMWFLSNSLGNYLSGLIGMLWTRWPKEQFFMLLTGLGVAAGLAIFAMSPWLSRTMGLHAPKRAE